MVFQRGDYALMFATVVLFIVGTKRGVGSVGTRAWVMLFTGRDAGDPLFLQAKQAQVWVGRGS